MNRCLFFVWLVFAIALPIQCGKKTQTITIEYVEANTGCVGAETTTEWMDGRPLLRCDWECATDPLSSAGGKRIPGRVTYWFSVEKLVQRQYRQGCWSKG